MNTRGRDGQTGLGGGTTRIYVVVYTTSIPLVTVVVAQVIDKRFTN
jgi:hypothetical protein